MTTMCTVQKSMDRLCTFINHTTFCNLLCDLQLSVASVVWLLLFAQFAGDSKKYFGTYHAELITSLRTEQCSNARAPVAQLIRDSDKNLVQILAESQSLFSVII